MAAATQAVKLGFNPLVQLYQTFNSAVVKYPFISGVIISGAKTSAADLFAQKVIEKKENIDWQRFGLFTAFGYLYLGGFQYVLYSKVICRVADPILNLTGAKYRVPVLTALDQFVYHPFMYLPAFYLFKGAAMQQSVGQMYEKFSQDFVSNCKALWAVWIPAQIINFKYLPRHMRVPYVALISFAWTVILSQMRGQCDEIKEEQQMESTIPLQETEQQTKPQLAFESSSEKNRQIEAEYNFEEDSADNQSQINKWVSNKLFGSYIKENLGALQLSLVNVSQAQQAELDDEENQEEEKEQDEK